MLTVKIWIDLLKLLRSYRGFKLRESGSPKVSATRAAKLCIRPQKCWTCKNVLEVLYHLARFGGARTSPAVVAAKNVEFFVCLSMMKESMMLPQGHAKQLQMRNKHSTWNIRSMLQLGKVQLLGEEMMRLGVDICGLSEVRWDGQGHFRILDGHTVVYSGRPTQGMSGVAVWIHRKIAGSLVGYEPVSD